MILKKSFLHQVRLSFHGTPPTTTCGLPMGALNYNLEIREMYPGQTITDGINNPPVFERQKYLQELYAGYVEISEMF